MLLEQQGCSKGRIELMFSGVLASLVTPHFQGNTPLPGGGRHTASAGSMPEEAPQKEKHLWFSLVLHWEPEVPGWDKDGGGWQRGGGGYDSPLVLAPHLNFESSRSFKGPILPAAGRFCSPLFRGW